MNYTATKWGKILSIVLIFSAVFLVFPKQIKATSYQQCQNTSDCKVGEFLYDDNYQPLAVGTSCALTVRKSNGDILLNAADMPPSSDGWYSYNVGTSGLAAGVYRGQMCCSTGADNMCLDKTFEISSGLNSSLIADIWSYPSRSLNSFGDIVSSIWNNSNRTLTSSNLGNGGSLATSEKVNSIGDSVADIATKLVTIESKVDTLQTSINSIKSETDVLVAKWGGNSVADIITYVNNLKTELGNNTQTCSDNTVYGQIQCLMDKWGSASAGTIYTAANNASVTATQIQSELNFNGKSTTAYDEMMSLKASVDSLETSVGATSDTSAVDSIFGRIKQVKEAIQNIDNTTLDLNDLMAKWGTLSANDIYSKVASLSTQVTALNTVTNVDNITNNNITQTADLADLKNQVLAMRALMDVNRLQLETLINKPIVKTWLEQGSIIFKSLITNPSTLVKQKMPFTYYFPAEVKQEDIIKKSDGLDIQYDSTKQQYFATENFDLAPKQTVVVEVEVKDIWTIPKEKIDSLKNQATELYGPLKKTSYFAQGATLYSDILASLDKINEIQSRAILPEDKIKLSTDTRIEMDAINRKLDSLKTIVSQAGSIGTLSGYIGGVQTMAVWGIVVVLIAGFAFLAIYIKSLNPKSRPPKISSPSTEMPVGDRRNHNHSHRGAVFASMLGISFGISSIMAYLYLNGIKPEKNTPMVLSATTVATVTSAPTAVPTIGATPTDELKVEEIQKQMPVVETPETTPTASPSVIPTLAVIVTPTVVMNMTAIANAKSIIVVPSINSYVNVRQTPDRNGILVTKVLSGKQMQVLAEKYNDLGEKWLNVQVDNISGWILSELTQEVQKAASAVMPSAKITILVPDRDVVYLYSRPSVNASVTYKITENQIADVLVETKRWAKVVLAKNNNEGWISQDFVDKSQ